MEKKGFTLIEIMAVIVVLGLLIAIITPVVNNLLKDSEDTLSDEQISMIVNASKKYMVEHSELLPEMSDGSKTFIYIDDLINNGVIDNDKVINPKTKEELDGCVVVNYNDSFNQYEYNYSDSPNDCLITVTFDPEGGSVEESSKQVRYNSTYGELPTPTREGYTFKGWRGKNAFDVDKVILKKYSSVKGDKVIIDASSVEGNVANWIESRLYNDDTFIKSFSNNSGIIEKDSTFNNINIKLNTNKSDGYFAYDISFLENGQTYKFSYILEKDYSKARVSFSNIQLEKGDTTTEFEPYQEYRSDTVVTKSSDHTLHAIWEIAS